MRGGETSRGKKKKVSEGSQALCCTTEKKERETHCLKKKKGRKVPGIMTTHLRVNGAPFRERKRNWGGGEGKRIPRKIRLHPSLNRIGGGRGISKQLKEGIN